MREFTIKILVRDFGETAVLMANRPEDGQYTIVINPKQLGIMEADPICALAHEIGHVLGFEFGLKGHKRIQALNNTKILSPEEAHIFAQLFGFTLKMENEAWDLAEEMFKLRSKAINSYKAGRKRFIDALLHPWRKP